MKRFFLVTLVLALFGIAANAQPQGLLGTWKATTMDVIVDGEVAMSMSCQAAGIDMKFVFKQNGAAYGEVSMNGEKESQKLTYKVSGTKVIMKDESGESEDITYSNGKLYKMLKEDGMDIRVNFKKQQ